MCKRFYFYECACECPLKDAEQNFLKKPVIILVFKLKSQVSCIKFDVGGGI